MMNDIGIETFKDGDIYCAVRPDSFIDLQESFAGFGETETEAIENLLQTEQEITDDN